MSYLDDVAKRITQPKTPGQRIAEHLTAVGAIGVGVAVAAYLKPTESDWKNEDRLVENSAKTGLMVMAVIGGVVGSAHLAMKAMEPNNYIDAPQINEQAG
jgi:hypothetical protein